MVNIGIVDDQELERISGKLLHTFLAFCKSLWPVPGCAKVRAEDIGAASPDSALGTWSASAIKLTQILRVGSRISLL